MKKIIGILAALIMCITLNSCVTAAQAQIDDMYDDVDISLVITYGTPFYDTDGLLLYYMYRDMFYYPYYYHNRYYLHRYSRPLPPHVYREKYRPIPRDVFRHHSPNVRHENHSPKPHRDVRPNRNHQPRPNVRPNTNQRRPTPNVRPNVTPKPNNNINRGGGSRPTPQPRTSTRTSVGSSHSGGGHFGGRR